LNAIVGWYQEKQAADVVATLKGDIALKATVVRNGQEEEIKARELVPGDIVYPLNCLNNHQIIVEEGQVIPGEARLICAYDNPEGFADYLDQQQQRELGHTKEKKIEEGDDLDDEDDEPHGYSLVSCDQSAITGESLAVDKYMGDTVYYTTGCKRGRAFA